MSLLTQVTPFGACIVGGFTAAIPAADYPFRASHCSDTAVLPFVEYELCCEEVEILVSPVAVYRSLCVIRDAAISLILAHKMQRLSHLTWKLRVDELLASSVIL